VLGSVTGAVVLLVGMSRIYLGVHYPSDVAAGYAAGASWLLVCALTVSLWRSSRRRP
jgi:undecaprenyl-diphosphatase